MAYYIQNLCMGMIKLVKTMEKTEKDPKAFRQSKLVKYEEIDITIREKSKLSISISTLYTDPEAMERKLKFMKECTKEDYDAIVDMFSGDILSAFKKLDEHTKNMRG